MRNSSMKIDCCDRNNHRRQLEQMQSQLDELELRSKTEISRLKSKYQTEIDELRLRYDSLKKIKSEMENHVKKLQVSVKDAQDRLIEEQTGHGATRDLLAASEKRFGQSSTFRFLSRTSLQHR